MTNIISESKTQQFINIFRPVILDRMKIPNANKGHEKLGCVVFTNYKKSSIPHKGHNQYSVGKYNGKYYESVHAEIDAMNKLKYNKSKKLKKINLFVFRVNNDGCLRNAKCCNNCQKDIYYIAKIKGYNIKNIYYTTSYNTIEKL